MYNFPRVCAACLAIVAISASAKSGLSKDTSANAALSQQQRILRQELRRLQRANAVMDFRKAVQEKDFRFIGYYGYTVVVPGVGKEGRFNRYVKLHGVKIIKGTSDVITTKDYKQLQAVVHRYVEPYNRLVLAYLKKPERRAIK